MLHLPISRELLACLANLDRVADELESLFLLRLGSPLLDCCPQRVEFEMIPVFYSPLNQRLPVLLEVYLGLPAHEGPLGAAIVLALEVFVEYSLSLFCQPIT